MSPDPTDRPSPAPDAMDDAAPWRHSWFGSPEHESEEPLPVPPKPEG